MLNPKEHRLALFDDISALIKDMLLELSGLADPTSDAEQKRWIVKAQTKLLNYEKTVIVPLKRRLTGPPCGGHSESKRMGCP